MFHVVSGPSHQILESSSKIESYSLDIQLRWFEDRHIAKTLRTHLETFENF